MGFMAGPENVRFRAHSDVRLVLSSMQSRWQIHVHPPRSFIQVAYRSECAHRHRYNCMLKFDMLAGVGAQMGMQSPCAQFHEPTPFAHAVVFVPALYVHSLLLAATMQLCGEGICMCQRLCGGWH